MLVNLHLQVHQVLHLVNPFHVLLQSVMLLRIGYLCLELISFLFSPLSDSFQFLLETLFSIGFNFLTQVTIWIVVGRNEWFLEEARVRLMVSGSHYVRARIRSCVVETLRSMIEQIHLILVRVRVINDTLIVWFWSLLLVPSIWLTSLTWLILDLYRYICLIWLIAYLYRWEIVLRLVD